MGGCGAYCLSAYISEGGRGPICVDGDMVRREEIESKVKARVGRLLLSVSRYCAARHLSS